MQQKDEQTVQNMVQIIKEQYMPCRIILFGSYARNEAGADTDLDLLIVPEKPLMNSIPESGNLLLYGVLCLAS